MSRSAPARSTSASVGPVRALRRSDSRPQGTGRRGRRRVSQSGPGRVRSPPGRRGRSAVAARGELKGKDHVPRPRREPRDPGTAHPSSATLRRCSASCGRMERVSNVRDRSPPASSLRRTRIVKARAKGLIVHGGRSARHGAPSCRRRLMRPPEAPLIRRVRAHPRGGTHDVLGGHFMRDQPGDAEDEQEVAAKPAARA